MQLKDHRPVSISSNTDQVSIHVAARLDGPATYVLADAINAALALGSEVHLRWTDPPIGDVMSDRPVLRLGPCPRERDRPILAAPAAGLLRLTRRSSCWTIDLARRRLCRTDMAVDWRLLAVSHWTPISEIHFTASSCRASSSLTRPG